MMAQIERGHPLSRTRRKVLRIQPHVGIPYGDWLISDYSYALPGEVCALCDDSVLHPRRQRQSGQEPNTEPPPCDGVSLVFATFEAIQANPTREELNLIVDNACSLVHADASGGGWNER